MKNFGRGLVVGCIAIAITTTSSASAGIDVHRDARNDVWHPEDFRHWKPAAARNNGDLLRFSITNQPRRLIVSANYRKMTRNDDENDLQVALKASGRLFNLSVQFDPFVRQGFFVLIDEATQETVNCDVNGRIAYASDRVAVRIPAACLGRPEWMRYRGFHRTYNEGWGLYCDDILTAEAPSDGWSPKVERQPR